MNENENTIESKKPEELLYEAIQTLSENQKWRALGFVQCQQLLKENPSTGKLN